MADVEPPMVGGYLRAVDSDEILICEAYGIAHSTAHSIRLMKTPNADKFAALIKQDANKNFTATFTLTEEGVDGEHSITLNKKPTKHCQFKSVSFYLLGRDIIIDRNLFSHY